MDEGSPQLILQPLLQLVVILVMAYVSGWAAGLLGQPRVVGMMVGGVLLGPSALGQIVPEFQSWLFHPTSLPLLNFLAQAGVGLYLFTVGLDFETNRLRERARAALMISLAGIAVPFLAAWPTASLIGDAPGLFGSEVSPPMRVLFLGSAMAITAFPMLVWMVRERGLERSTVGNLAIAAGAIDDVVAWCILAGVVSAVSGDPSTIAKAVGGAATMALLASLLGRRMLALVSGPAERRGNVNLLDGARLGLVLLAFLAFSEWSGLHAVFGGFLCGLCLPRGRLSAATTGVLNPVVGPWLLPFFFTFSGLHTRLDLVLSAEGLALTALVLAVSILSKGGACWAAARLAGIPGKQSLGIGVLMNARGLMELILLGIGLKAGIVGPLLFSVLALMAIVTTAMAGPLFDRLVGEKSGSG
jgi:Kef-type K+ transport system membrane component KefB